MLVTEMRITLYVCMYIYVCICVLLVYCMYVCKYVCMCMYVDHSQRTFPSQDRNDMAPANWNWLMSPSFSPLLFTDSRPCATRYNL